MAKLFSFKLYNLTPEVNLFGFKTQISLVFCAHICHNECISLSSGWFSFVLFLSVIPYTISSIRDISRTQATVVSASKENEFMMPTKCEQTILSIKDKIMNYFMQRKRGKWTNFNESTEYGVSKIKQISDIGKKRIKSSSLDRTY